MQRNRFVRQSLAASILAAVALFAANAATAQLNRILWTGTMGNKPSPTTRSGLDLQDNRAELLKNVQMRQAAQAGPSESGQRASSPSAAPGSSM
jgi:hypothetical protein